MKFSSETAMKSGNTLQNTAKNPGSHSAVAVLTWENFNTPYVKNRRKIGKCTHMFSENEKGKQKEEFYNCSCSSSRSFAPENARAIFHFVVVFCHNLLLTYYAGKKNTLAFFFVL
jgi:hypothetical protein